MSAGNGIDDEEDFLFELSHIYFFLPLAEANGNVFQYINGITLFNRLFFISSGKSFW
jgi:hypothetical protein